MSRHPLADYNVLHAETVRGHYGPPPGDYPMHLLTRRTLAQSAEEIVRTREHAPGSVRMHHGPRLSRRPG